MLRRALLGHIIMLHTFPSRLMVWYMCVHFISSLFEVLLWSREAQQMWVCLLVYSKEWTPTMMCFYFPSWESRATAKKSNYQRHIRYATQKLHFFSQMSMKEYRGWPCSQMRTAKQLIMEFTCTAVYEAHHYHGFMVTYERLLHVTFGAANPP